MAESQIKWHWYHGGAVLLLICGSVGTGLMAKLPLSNIWLITLVAFAAAVMVIGHGVTGYWRGAFIDDRNVMSLSRFQMLAWTVLILSAFFAAVLWNVHLNIDQPIEKVVVSSSLWGLMGISTTSLVASPLILSGKKNQNPDLQQMTQTRDLLQAQGAEGSANQGLVMTNRKLEQARWTDMFTGEETSNAAHMDLSRVQMFFFTVVSLLGYGVAIAGQFSSPAALVGVTYLPELSGGILGLIGISHTGYLVTKAIPLSRTGPTPVADAASSAPQAVAAGQDEDHPAVG